MPDSALLASDGMASPTPIPPVRIVLLGMMGSGKSSVGRALATRTGWRFVDNDALVEAATGRTARELLEERGEPAMRQAEAAALEHAVGMPPPVVVATAAGTVLDPANRRLIDGGGFVVWLNAPAGVLAERAADGAHRPWLEDDPVGWFQSAKAERDGHYAAISDLEIPTHEMRPDEAAERIVAAISARG